MIIERAKPYHSGGVTTLMSVGDPLEFLRSIPTWQIAAAGAVAFFLYKKYF